ncbi:sulfotransferase family 2 domain-containing protein [Bacillus sp. SRB3LM]|uniref:sulfotransferase family 2 domain-containing protein n=1 Tax=Bacillus sp. SRB3LM TaxID=2608689 RepID=UPI0018C444C3|nr:sulfotransferase family 2 domain-containing protein [Bacillus sp. SRB3LM]MBG0968033.1 sulfotransferase family protein [Bacillus sp. SRB3LM]MBG0971049.1 sulfotransferase family protein [Bacillus sp. SRB3LM]MBG0971716.1 sulfotransferase family protein [Bacillus sp. SRB3LM]
MSNSNASNIIVAQGRIPHFQKDFPLILFWSQKSGCTSFAHWFFYQINELKTAFKYHSFIHNYEIYKAAPSYQSELIKALQTNQKKTYKLVRNPYYRAVSSFVAQIDPLGYQLPQWKPIKQFLYKNENSVKGFSFKQYLYYIQHIKKQQAYLDPHIDQQYIPGEEQFITSYIYLEKFDMTIRALEMKYNLKKSPLHILTKSWHHQSEKMSHKGNYADVDITDPLFPRLPTYKSFYDNECLQLVHCIFHQDFKMYKYSSVLGN